MDSATHNLIAALHNTSFRYVLALTGGGARAASLLLGVPGASRTILEVLVPYHQQSLCDFLGHEPEQYCSAQTSQLLARRAWERACHLTPGEDAVGVGCTASLASDRPKRGEHRFHFSIHSHSGTTTWTLVLAKGKRDREGEEELLDAILLNALAERAGLDERIPVDLLESEAVVEEVDEGKDTFTAFFAGESEKMVVLQDGQLTTDSKLPDLLLPGSFNPLHRGHLRMARAAVDIVGGSLAFELTVQNVDKGTISPNEVLRRLQQFQWHYPLWLTREQTFVRKALLFPGVVFVVGVDTAERLVQTRYYDDSEQVMEKAFASIRKRGCRFLVAGRCVEDRFVTISDVSIPDYYRDLFEPIPEEKLRVDVSSTFLRSR